MLYLPAITVLISTSAGSPASTPGPNDMDMSETGGDASHPDIGPHSPAALDDRGTWVCVCVFVYVCMCEFLYKMLRHWSKSCMHKLIEFVIDVYMHITQHTSFPPLSAPLYDILKIGVAVWDVCE
jgi:hypothetical protein